MARKQRSVERREVVLERDGERYVGSYRIERGMITVYFGDLSEKTQLGDSLPDMLAHTLLHELVLKHRSEGRG